MLAVLRGHLIINFKSYSNFGKLRGFKFEARLLNYTVGGTARRVSREHRILQREVVKSDYIYVLDPDAGLLLKRAATAIKGTVSRDFRLLVLFMKQFLSSP